MKKMILIMVVLLHLFTVVQLYSEPTFGPLTEPFLRMMESERFHISATLMANATTTDISIYQRGENRAMVMTVAGQRMRMVVRDGIAHIIVDSQRMILTAPADEADTAGLVDISQLRFVEEGTARFGGRRRTYEEYTIGEERIQYFVDGERFLGMRIFEGRRAVAEIMVNEFNQRVPNHVFDIPTNFTVREVENFRM